MSTTPGSGEITPSQQALFTDAVRQLAGPLRDIHFSAASQENVSRSLRVAIASIAGIELDPDSIEVPPAEPFDLKSARREYVFGSGEVACRYSPDEVDLTLSELRETDRPGILEDHAQSFTIDAEGGPSYSYFVDTLYPDGRVDSTTLENGEVFTEIHFQHCIGTLALLSVAIEAGTAQQKG